MLAYDLNRDIESSVGVWLHGKGGAGGRVRANCILHLWIDPIGLNCE